MMSQFELTELLKQECKKPPPRIVLEGDKKIGKTSFASRAPGVVFIPTEDGALGVDVPKLSPPGKARCETWAEVIGAVEALGRQDHDFQWLAVDTLDEAWHFCQQMVCDAKFKSVWEAGNGQDGYNAWGRGDKAAVPEFRELLARLDYLQQKRGMGILLLSHVDMIKQANTFGADFHKLGGALGKAWPLVSNWADQIGYACQDIRASKRDGETKAKAVALSNERYIRFDGGPELDAGCRAGYEMPERILLDWDEYATHLAADPVGPLVSQALEMYKTAGEDLRGKLDKRFGDVTEKTLRELGKAKLDTLVGWMLTQTKDA